jgi:hypothetical protein
MQRVEHHIFAFVTAGMSRNHFAAKADQHFMHVAFDQYLAMLITPAQLRPILHGSGASADRNTIYPSLFDH